MLKQMINPDLYHGKLPWNKFEGWYFKITFNDRSFAFIPGIFHGDSKMEPHSFIQILDGKSVLYDYVKFPANFFRSKKDRLELNIGENMFSLSNITLRLDTGYSRIDADLALSNVIKWNNRKDHRSMGYYNFIPFMECYSQVCAMETKVTGQIKINGLSCKSDNGNGYIEKNWGSQFPLWWIWVQCNCFSKPGISLSASIGHIPFLLGSFKGFLIGLNIGKNFYYMTSMNGSKLEIKNIGDDKIIYAHNNTYLLEIITKTNKDEFMICNAPKNGQMIPLVKETLSATIKIKLKNIKTSEILFEDIGYNTGIEYGGEGITSYS